MNTPQSSIPFTEVFSPECAMSGLLGTNQLLQMPTMLEDLPLMSQQASVPHEKLGSLTHQLYDQVPFLKCIDFEVDHVSKLKLSEA